MRTNLTPPQNTVAEETSSLVLVHDFGDGAHRTWTTPGFFWPLDLLPRELPRARVLVYGYPTRRPLSIIPAQAGHLLGCLLDERKQSNVSAPLSSLPPSLPELALSP